MRRIVFLLALLGLSFGKPGAGGQGAVASTSQAQEDPLPTRGRFLYAVNRFEDRLSAFEIRPAFFREISPLATGDGPVAAALDPCGDFLFVANEFDGTVSYFSIEGDLLTLLGTIPVDPRPASLAVFDPGSQSGMECQGDSKAYLYVAHSATRQIQILELDRATRILEGPGGLISVGEGPASMALAPDGRSVVVANSLDDTLDWIRAATNGALSDRRTIPAEGGSCASAHPRRQHPVRVVFSREGQSLLVANRFGNSVSLYSHSSEEGLEFEDSLCLDSGSSGEEPEQSKQGNTDSGPVALTVLPSSDAAVPDTILVAHANSNSISSLRMDPSGTSLSSPVTLLSDPGLNSLSHPSDMALGSGMKTLFVTNLLSNDLSVFDIQAQDEQISLLPLQRLRVGRRPISLAVLAPRQTPEATLLQKRALLFVANHNSNTVSVLSHESEPSAAKDLGRVTIDGRPRSVAIDRGGQFLFTASETSGDSTLSGRLDLLAIQGPDGIASEVCSLPLEGSPTSVATLDATVFVALDKGDASGTISIFEFDSTAPNCEGMLELVSPEPAGGSPRELSASPNGCVYFLQDIEGDALGGAVGILEDMSGFWQPPNGLQPATTGKGPVSLAAAGGHVIVANRFRREGGGGELNVFEQVEGGCQLHEVAGSPFAVGLLPSAVAALEPPSDQEAALSQGTEDAEGLLILVADAARGHVDAVRMTKSLDGAVGNRFDLVGSSRVGGAPNSIAARAGSNGDLLLVSNLFSDDVSVLSLNLQNGTLSLLDSVKGGADPVSIAVHPSGELAFVANVGSRDVRSLRLDAGQASLVELGLEDQDVETGAGPLRIASDPGQNFLYVPNSLDDTISVYRINRQSGSLTPLCGPHSKGMEECQRVGANGLPGAGSWAIASGPMPFGQQVAHPGFVYVTNLKVGSLAWKRIDEVKGVAGESEPPLSVGQDPVDVQVHPGGRFIFVANSGSSSITPCIWRTVDEFACSEETPVPQADGILSLAIHPRLGFLYAAGFLSKTLSRFSINEGGSLSFEETSTFEDLNAPTAIVIDPSGEFAFVTNAALDNSSIAQFCIEEKDGLLHPLAPPAIPTGGAGPGALSVDPSGDFLYVSNSGSDSISIFAINRGPEEENLPCSSVRPGVLLLLGSQPAGSPEGSVVIR